jgi:hypothetical protein
LADFKATRRSRAADLGGVLGTGEGPAETEDQNDKDMIKIDHYNSTFEVSTTGH